MCSAFMPGPKCELWTNWRRMWQHLVLPKLRFAQEVQGRGQTQSTWLPSQPTQNGPVLQPRHDVPERMRQQSHDAARNHSRIHAFDLTACVEPYVPLCAPTTCMAQGIDCGPAGDGCGNLLDCGQCPMGEYCGGSGPGKCGTMNSCTPATCMSQCIECGQAGDGCGNVLDCGNCATGAVCGLNSPGKCGSLN